MSIVEFALRRRVTIAMLAVAMVLFGLVAFNRLRINLLPELSYPSLTIETRFDGAAPSEIEQLITRPLEESVGVVSGVERLSSVSQPGLSRITLEFGWDRDMDFAAIDVREKLGLVRLPESAQPPVLLRFDPGQDPIIRLYVTGEEDLFRLRKVAEEVVEKDLESAQGVAAVELRGGYEDEIEIELDQGKLALLGVSIAKVAESLDKANVDQAGGSLYEREARYLVRTRNRLLDLQDIEQTVISQRDGRRVTVGDVAEVRRTHKQRDTITRLGSREAVELAIYKEGDANTTAVAAAVKGRLQQVRQRVPRGIEIITAVDQSSFIVASVDEVLRSAAIGGAFAVLVLLAFLRDLRSTLIIATAIPVSVVSTFFLMYRTGTTLNVMSLGGLALGIGMLVDSAIVVLESISKQREAGLNPLESARVGAGEVGRAVVASTLTTIAVFVPVVFLDGIAAQLFRDMAVTVCFSLVVSLAVSLTVIPMMSALSGQGETPSPSSSRVARVLAWPIVAIRWVLGGVGDLLRVILWPLARLFDAAIGAVTRVYPGVLRLSLRRPATVVGMATIVLVAAFLSIPRLGLDLIPPLSQGEFSFVAQMPQGTPLARTDAIARGAAAVLEDDPRVERYATIVGQGASPAQSTSIGGEHVALTSVRMKPGSSAQDEQDVISKLRSALNKTPARRIQLERPSVFTLRQPIEIELYGSDMAELAEIGTTVRDAIASLPGVVEARSTAQYGHPEIQVRFDRARISKLGLSVQEVATTTRHKLQGEVSTRFREQDRDIDVRVRSVGRQTASPAELRDLIVAQNQGAPIRLASVAEVIVANGPSEVRRLGQNRVAIVSADVEGRDMGAVARDVERVLAGTPLPDGVTVRVAGHDEEMQSSLRSLLFALALAGFLVYLVMASQFESLIYPFVVIFTLPLGGAGVIAALLLTSGTVNVVAMIGVVMLAGIIVNNAIVLVDAINRRRQAGLGLRAAVLAAGRERLRPILMTTATTVLGLLPMAAATGAGAELRSALAIAVIGGLAVGTVLTLVVIPVVYQLVTRDRPLPSEGA